jgi:hypothetical protein
MFPDAPAGTSLYGLYVAYHILSGNKSVSNSKRALFGNAKAKANSIFGTTIHATKARLPPSAAFDTDRFLLRGTAFGFYTAELPAVRQNALKDYQRSGLPGGLAANRFVAGPNRRLVKPHLHLCTHCVREDVFALGLSFWRVVHQLPGVYHCPDHMQPLSGKCLTCGESQASEREWRTPNKLCPHCASEATPSWHPPLSRTYMAFIRFCGQVVQGEEVGLSSEFRTAIYQSALDSFCQATEEETLKAFTAMVVGQWNCDSASQLQEMLDAPFDSRFIAAATKGEDTMANPTGHLALLAAIFTYHLPDDVGGNNGSWWADDLLENMVPASKQGNGATTMQDEVANMALREGLPAIVGIKMLAGASDNLLWETYNISEIRLKRLRAQMQASGLRFQSVLRKVGPWNAGVPEDRRALRIQTNREKVLAAIRRGGLSRDAVKRFAYTALTWCRREDREWLDKTLPAKSANELLSSEDRKEIYRARILQYLEDNPGSPKSRMDTMLRTPYRWCEKNDKSWLKEVILEHYRKRDLALV